MKKLEIIIRPEELEQVKSILQQCGVTGLMITNVMGYGNQRGFTQMYRGTEFEVNLLPKIKVARFLSMPLRMQSEAEPVNPEAVLSNY